MVHPSSPAEAPIKQGLLEGRKGQLTFSRGPPYMTSTGFFLILDPSPSLSTKSILFVRKFGAFFYLPLLYGRHIWKEDH